MANQSHFVETFFKLQTYKQKIYMTTFNASM